MAEPVVISGPKRGNGRQKRQRMMKAAAKQEAVKERAAKKLKRRRVRFNFCHSRTTLYTHD